MDRPAPAWHFARVQTEPTKRTCEGCSLCCKVMRVDWMEKPAGQWCRHSVPAGCGIHGSHPELCRAFYCLWIDEPKFGDEWKPALSRFVMTKSASGMGLLINVDADTPDAWKAEPYYSALKNLAGGVRMGAYVAICIGPKVIIVFPEQDLEICDLAPGSKIAVQYKDSPEGRQPYAAVQTADGVIHEFFGETYAN